MYNLYYLLPTVLFPYVNLTQELILYLNCTVMKFQEDLLF